MSARVKAKGAGAVPCRCRRCGRALGMYRPVFGDGAPLRLVEPPEVYSRWSAVGEAERGPRTGAGIYLEGFEDRFYIRVRCKCGRNEKIALGKFEIEPRTERGVSVFYA